MRWLAAIFACGLVLGCGDDTTSGSGSDMSAGGGGGSGADMSAASGDLATCNAIFGGFASGSSPQQLACPCGCVIDAMESATVNPLWGASHSSKSQFAPMAAVALGTMLDFDGSNSFEYVALYSAGPSEQFYLNGDFDMLLDYDLVTAAPGEAHVILSVRDPGTVQGTMIYSVERAVRADGSNVYASMLGGVPSVALATAATHGTLRIVRHGFTYTTYGDGQQVTQLIAQAAGPVAVNVTATLNGCMLADGAASCAFGPRLHMLRLASGTLASSPQ